MATAGEGFDLGDPLGSFGATWQRILREPRTFFEALPVAGGLQAPLVFAVICLAIGGFGYLIFGGGIGGWIGILLIGLMRLVVGSAIVTLIAQQLLEGRGDYEATFRVLGYSTAVAVFIGIPFLKYFAALYGAYLVIVGLAKAHGFDAGRAMLTAVASAVTGFVIVYALDLGDWMVRVNPLLR
jgi:hypothetical protein